MNKRATKRSMRKRLKVATAAVNQPKHQYGEAFLLMTYRCSNCGYSERIYNSRNGIAAFRIICPNCTAMSFMHVRPDDDRNIGPEWGSALPGQLAIVGPPEKPRLLRHPGMPYMLKDLEKAGETAIVDRLRANSAGLEQQVVVEVDRKTTTILERLASMTEEERARALLGMAPKVATLSAEAEKAAREEMGAKELVNPLPEISVTESGGDAVEEARQKMLMDRLKETGFGNNSFADMTMNPDEAEVAGASYARAIQDQEVGGAPDTFPIMDERDWRIWERGLAMMFRVDIAGAMDIGMEARENVKSGDDTLVVRGSVETFLSNAMSVPEVIAALKVARGV